MFYVLHYDMSIQNNVCTRHEVKGGFIMAEFYKDKKTSNIFQNFIAFTDQEMAPDLDRLNANTTDAAAEKHVPCVTITGNKVDVTVGSVPHPMLEEHYIAGIYIETRLGGQFRVLNPGEAPSASFVLADGDEFVAAYEYCNLHGLWKKSAE